MESSARTAFRQHQDAQMFKSVNAPADVKPIRAPKPKSTISAMFPPLLLPLAAMETIPPAKIRMDTASANARLI